MEESREFTRTSLVNRCFGLGHLDPHPDDLTLVRSESGPARMRHRIRWALVARAGLELLMLLRLKEPTSLEPFRRECPGTSAELSWRRGTKASLACGLTSYCSRRAKHSEGKHNLLLSGAQFRSEHRATG